MKIDSIVASKVNTVLNYLARAFPSKTPELSGEVWVINLYLLVSNIIQRYAIKSREKDLHDLYLEFWKQIEKVRATYKGNPEEIRFVNANTAGTTSKQNIFTRFDIMKKQFMQKYLDLELLDPKRLFDHYEKTIIFRRDNGICQQCGKTVSWEEYQADHIRAHITGGQTTISNGQVLCSNCNAKKGAS